MNTHMSLNYSGDQLFLPNVVRAVGQALILTPLTAIAMMSIQPKDAANASGLFNMLRNLGGAVGTAALGTIVTKREQFHSNIIGQAVTTAREEVRQRLDQMTNYFMAHGVSDHAAAQHQAVIALGKTVKRQALVMGFSDTFAVIGIMLAVAAVLCCSPGRASPAPAPRRIDGPQGKSPHAGQSADFPAVTPLWCFHNLCGGGGKPWEPLTARLRS